MKLELSPSHPMHRGLCRGHGGSVWLVGVVMWVFTDLFTPKFTPAQVWNGVVNSIRGISHPSNPAPYMSQGYPWAS